ncbi:MAG: response regulator [Candidatus Sungiibacteriota bacterium]
MTLSSSKDDTPKKKTIVLIEDERVILELLRIKLQNAGMIVYTANDGISGLALIKEKKPDLVLLDMLLPGMNGLHVLEGMKTEGLLPAIPVLIISNSGQPAELARAMELGARDYLIKVNFDPNEVLDRAKTILDVAPLTDSVRGKIAASNNVLIVEDDILLVGLLERKFAASGYRVQKALDVDEARHLITKGSPDVILLDLVLSGIDGFSFLMELKRDERTKNIPVVIISNLGQQEEIARGMRLGAADYIIKANISPAEIVEKVGALIVREKKKIE